MRFATTIVFLVAFLGGISAYAAEKIELHVFYAGCPRTERMQDFQSLLEEHFSEVTVADMSTLREPDALGYDVVIFDWNAETWDPKRGRLRENRRLQDPLRLSAGFDRPTVLLGETGGRVTAFLKLKIDWLCLCLGDAAFDLAVEHEVFHKPLPVAPEFVEIDVPDEFRLMTLDTPGPKVSAWKAQTKTWPEIDPGLVSTLYGFSDSPDCELFARGISQKGPDTVALARQANYFLWGFSAKPSDMTPAARRLFVNAICYIKQFAGAKRAVSRVARGREWALRCVRAAAPEEFLHIWKDKLRREVAEHPAWIPDKYAGDATQYIADQLAQIRKSDEAFFELSQPEELRTRFGKEAARYVEYYRSNLEYLRPHDDAAKPYQFIVDEDVKSLGLSNRTVELLDRCITMLEQNERPELAQTILRRYTSERFDSPDDWRAWFDEHRDRLFFSDVGGYRFFVTDVSAR